MEVIEMCEMCEQYIDGPIILKSKRVPFSLDLELVMDEGCLRADLESDDGEHYDARIPIKYCPFCGELLKEQEEL